MVETSFRNGAPVGSTSSSSTLPASASVLSLGPAGKILCVADIRGDFERLNQYIDETQCCAVIHTGDLGFMDGESPARMAPRILRHVLSYTPLIPNTHRAEMLSHPHGPALFSLLHPQPSSPSSFLLSQLGRLLTGEIRLKVPVFCVYGPVEDVVVLEKFRTGEYEVENLMVLDEACSRLVEVGGLRLRLLGLGGAIMMHKMFDNGDATGTIAGGNGTVWATALQIGELVDTAQRVFDPTETRLLVTHGPVGKDGLLSQLALALKADLTVSGSLHFRFIASFNEFGVNGDPESFRQKLTKSRAAFMEVYESARPQLEKLLQSDQQHFLALALEVAQKIPSFESAGEEDQMWKNCWNWNLSEATYGKLVLNIKDARVSAETISHGLNFGYRQHRKSAQPTGQAQIRPATSGITTSSVAPTQTPPPGLLNNTMLPGAVKPAAAGPPVRKPIAPAANVLPKGGLTSPIGSKFTGNLSQQNRFANGPIPHPPASLSKPAQPQARPGQQSSQAGAEQAVAPSNVAAGQNKPTSTTNLTSRPQADRQQPPRREINGSAAPGNARQDPRTSKPVPTGPAAMNGRPSAAMANSAPIAPDIDNGTQEANGRKPPAKSKTPREPKQNGPAQSQQQTKPKENGGAREKDASKAEPAEASASEPVGQVKGENGGSAEVAAKLSDPSGAPGGTKPYPPRNPFSLYVKNLPTALTEDELRGLWGEEERSKITRVKIPFLGEGKTRGFAYVEFANDEDMQAALSKHGQDLKGQAPHVSISAPPGPGGGSRGGRGGGNAGPGGFRGGPGRGRGGGQQRGSGSGGAKGEWRAASTTGATQATTSTSTPAAQPASTAPESW